ncbi:hypothetical protein [Streptomyces sp. NRRL S-378]|nr:hypothetical protein [Streptomyces sp. NRRL S-378]
MPLQILHLDLQGRSAAAQARRAARADLVTAAEDDGGPSRPSRWTRRSC